MNTQIPLYRAKKLDSDKYVIGYLNEVIYDRGNEDDFDFENDEQEVTKFTITQYMTTQDEDFEYCEFCNFYEVDPSTLAIHFPDMIDSEGNKIFASLSESGKGGDVVECWTKEGANLMNAIMIYKNYNIGITYAWGFHRYTSFKMIDEIENKAVKVIGIQK